MLRITFDDAVEGQVRVLVRWVRRICALGFVRTENFEGVIEKEWQAGRVDMMSFGGVKKTRR